MFIVRSSYNLNFWYYVHKTTRHKSKPNYMSVNPHTCMYMQFQLLLMMQTTDPGEKGFKRSEEARHWTQGLQRSPAKGTWLPPWVDGKHKGKMGQRQDLALGHQPFLTHWLAQYWWLVLPLLMETISPGQEPLLGAATWLPSREDVVGLGFEELPAFLHITTFWSSREVHFSKSP